MLGYISSTRKKSCRQCVKAKRRCDLGFPCCRRCFTKSLDCAYPNASVREAEVVIRQTTPDLAPVTNTTALGPPEPPPAPSSIDPILLQSPDATSSPESDKSCENTQAQPCGEHCYEPRVPKQLLPQLWAPSYLNREQVLFSVSAMWNFVPALAHAGHNAFIHEKLYRDHQPPAYQDSCSLSALYLAKTKQNIPILTKSIDSKIAALVAASPTWTLTEHLAAVQALIIYQVIRLFDADLAQQPRAAGQNRLLENWTARLWKRFLREPPATASFATPFAAWVFAESVRRTVLMSVFLRGGWSCVTRDGVCDQVPLLARLPLSRDDSLWSTDEELFAAQHRCMGECLVAYGDYGLEWKPGRDDPKQLSDYQRLLLVPCRGGDDPRLLI